MFSDIVDDCYILLVMVSVRFLPAVLLGSQDHSHISQAKPRHPQYDL